VQTRLIEVFEPFPEVLAVYLFGSRARGKARQESDYDLGVVFASGARDVYLELLGRLVGAGAGSRGTLTGRAPSSALRRWLGAG